MNECLALQLESPLVALELLAGLPRVLLPTTELLLTRGLPMRRWRSATVEPWCVPQP